MYINCFCHTLRKLTNIKKLINQSVVIVLLSETCFSKDCGTILWIKCGRVYSNGTQKHQHTASRILRPILVGVRMTRIVRQMHSEVLVNENSEAKKDTWKSGYNTSCELRNKFLTDFCCRWEFLSFQVPQLYSPK